ncbi:hypothetical protein [Microvirga massiliensis]|uniref:hypothetical protein n=1 Tax=Microvirga massiliensis TaxID=1033741 RepID=UPI00062B624F|nr:hypothetical protein [Microvirga massiliensis]
MKTHALEMMLATLMVTCGITLMWPGDTFLLPHYAVMKRWINEPWGGFALLIIGLVRWWAILRSEQNRNAPIWRLVGCCIGSGYWLSLVFAIVIEVLIERTHPDGLGPPLLLAVAATAFVFEIFAGLRGGTDLFAQDSFRWREKAWLRARE